MLLKERITNTVNLHTIKFKPCLSPVYLSPNDSILFKQGMENWVICRIFLKKRGNSASKNDDEKSRLTITRFTDCKSMKSKPIFYDFMATSKKRRTDLNLTPDSSSSGSSGITDDAGSCDEHEENSRNQDDVSNLRKEQSS